MTDAATLRMRRRRVRECVIEGLEEAVVAFGEVAFDARRVEYGSVLDAQTGECVGCLEWRGQQIKFSKHKRVACACRAGRVRASEHDLMVTLTESDGGFELLTFISGGTLDGRAKWVTQFYRNMRRKTLRAIHDVIGEHIREEGVSQMIAEYAL